MGIATGVHQRADESGVEQGCGQVSQFFPYENGYSVIKVLERDPARDKTFKEAGTELSSAFQEYESKRLSETWAASLRAKYPVVLHPELLAPLKDAK